MENKVKNNNSEHEKLICYDIVSIFLILTSLFHSCAVHPGSYLIAVLLSVYKLNAMACEVVFNYRAVWILFLPAENCYRRMNLLYEYFKRYVVVKS